MAQTQNRTSTGLNQWLPSDNFNTTQLSEDNKIIDERIRGICNPNLYINGGLRISQRGTTFTADSKYGVDRFRATGGGTYKHLGETGGIEVTSGTVTLSYTMENGDFTSLDGKTVIQSWSLNGVVNHGAPFTLTSPTTISPVLNSGDILNWIKLEAGEVATDFIDVPMAQELLKCQRYYYVPSPLLILGQSAENINAGIYAAEFLQFPYEMRITPSTHGNFSMRVTGGEVEIIPSEFTQRNTKSYGLFFNMPSNPSPNVAQASVVARDLYFDAEIY